MTFWPDRVEWQASREKQRQIGRVGICRLLKKKGGVVLQESGDFAYSAINHCGEGFRGGESKAGFGLANREPQKRCWVMQGGNLDFSKAWMEGKKGRLGGRTTL